MCGLSEFKSKLSNILQRETHKAMFRTPLLASLFKFRPQVFLPPRTLQTRSMANYHHYHNELHDKLQYTRTQEFQKQLQSELDQAKEYIETRVRKGEKGFVVLDVDDTVLDHRGFYEGPYQEPPYGEFYSKWDKWVHDKKAPVLAAAKPLVEWLNKKRIPFVYITGRVEAQREATMQNLIQADLLGDSFKGLYCKPDKWWEQTTAEHKKRVIERLEQETRQKAIASIGDRVDDMVLNEAERNFKLSSSIFYPPRDKSKHKIGPKNE
jgi:predicted secreted acid phosphatase